MTIEREEPELLVAVCDRCGDRQILDIDQDADKEAIAAELELCGWDQRKPEKQRFVGAFDHGHVATYPQDFCADCRDGEPGPKPRFGPGRSYRRGPVDAFANDPCDEWPRSAIWAALGLNSMCGHPDAGHPCPHCEAGYPIGRVDSWWRRA